MKKAIVLLLVLPLLLMHSCKTQGTGTLEFTIEVNKADASQDGMDTLQERLKQRLISIGIGEEDIAFKTDQNRVTIDVRELSNYKKIDHANIRKMIISSGELCFRETYTLDEIRPVIYSLVSDSTFKPMLDSLFRYFNPVSDLFPDYINTFMIRSSSTVGYDVTHCELGTCDTHDTAMIMSFFDTLRIRNKLPSNVEFAWSTGKNFMGVRIASLMMLRRNAGDAGKLCEPKMDEVKETKTGDLYSISGTMHAGDAYKWSELTEQNSGKYLAVLLDDRVVSFIQVLNRVENGALSISGIQSKDDADNILQMLLTPKLPFSVSFVDEKELP